MNASLLACSVSISYTECEWSPFLGHRLEVKEHWRSQKDICTVRYCSSLAFSSALLLGLLWVHCQTPCLHELSVPLSGVPLGIAVSTVCFLYAG